MEMLKLAFYLGSGAAGFAAIMGLTGGRKNAMVWRIIAAFFGGCLAMFVALSIVALAHNYVADHSRPAQGIPEQVQPEVRPSGLSVDIQGQTLTVPEPRDMVVTKGEDKEYDQILKMCTPPGMLMHTAFAKGEMWKDYLAHKSTGGTILWSYAYVQSPVDGPTSDEATRQAYEVERNALRSQFGDVNPALAGELPHAVSVIGQRLEEKWHAPVGKLELGTPIALGTLEDSDKLFATFYLMSGKLNGNGQAGSEYHMLVGAAAMPVRARLLILVYFQRVTPGMEEVPEAVDVFRSWTRAVRTANM